MYSRQYKNDFNHPRPPVTDELLWTLSTQAIFSFFGNSISRTTGWEDTDWVGRPLHSFIHEFDIFEIKNRYSEVLKGETVRFQDVRILTSNATHIAFVLCFVPQIEKGVVKEVIVLGHPVNTEENTSDEMAFHPLKALRLYNKNEKPPSSTIIEYAGLAKLLEGMLGNAPIGFALLDEKLRFVCLNESFAELTGFSPSQHWSRTFHELLPKVATLIEPVMQKVLTTEESVIDYEAILQGDSASCKCAQMSFYPIPDLHGGICGVATIAVDITARKDSEASLKKTAEELVRSNIALEEFSHIASHDLKEPIRTIASYSSLLKRELGERLDGKSREYVTFISDGTKRMQRLIDKILEYARAGKVDREFTEVDCASVVQTIESNLSASLEDSGGSITYDPLPFVHGDQSLLEQIFQNLILDCAPKFGRKMSSGENGVTGI